MLCTMNVQNSVNYHTQWLKCLGTQGSGVPAPLIIDKWRSCTYNVVKMHSNGNKYRLRKRKANMASNIHSHQHLMGPSIVALIVYAAAHLPSTALYLCVCMSVANIGPYIKTRSSKFP